MFSFLRIPVVSEFDPRVNGLRRSLDEFYSSTRSYTAFHEDSVKPEFWSPVRQAVNCILSAKGSCRVLEFGAGRSQFGAFLGEMRERVVWHVQDVTSANFDVLRERADRVHVGPIESVKERYDVIFSTFVWEHVSNPRVVLAHLLELLEPGGRLIVVSPRYDFPLYVPPSARHYPRWKQALVCAWLQGQRVRARWDEKSRFLVHLEPAVLAKPWFRDSDAIHWVGGNDLALSLPPGFVCRKLAADDSAPWPNKVLRHLIMLFVEVERVSG